MIPKLEKILFCTQMWPTAMNVYRHAYAMAVRFEAKIEEDAIAALQKAIEEFFSAEIGAGDWGRYVERIVVMRGAAKDEILKQIDSVGADLVVLGGHRPGLLDLLIGSTASRVIGESKVPVLVVPESPNRGE